MISYPGGNDVPAGALSLPKRFAAFADVRNDVGRAGRDGTRGVCVATVPNRDVAGPQSQFHAPPT